MAQTVLGIFSNRVDAEGAITDLESSGYNTKDISIIMKNLEEAQVISNNTGANVADGAVSGATTGALVGAVAGLLIGIGAIAVPGIGALLIGGPIAAALGITGAAGTTVSGAITGGLAGGLVGALVGLGVPEEDAHIYENRLKEGAILVAVPTKENDDMDAKAILNNHHAEKVSQVSLNN